MHWSDDSGDWLEARAVACRLRRHVAEENGECQQRPARRSQKQHGRAGRDSEPVAAVAQKPRKVESVKELPLLVVVVFPS
jgi:hypothetical protein